MATSNNENAPKKVITKFHITLEICSYVMMLISLGMVIYAMNHITGEVATHFDGHGNPDAYGSPASFLIIPIVMLLVNSIISLVVHLCPTEFYNIPFEVKPERETQVYSEILRLPIYLIFYMGIITLTTTITSIYEKGKLGLYAVYIFLALLFPTIIIVCYRAYKINQAD